MTISREDVIKIARMSRIALHDDEVEKMRKHLDDVLTYASSVQKIANIECVVRLENKLKNVFREDIIEESCGKNILQSAPEIESEYFVVPKIIDIK